MKKLIVGISLITMCTTALVACTEAEDADNSEEQEERIVAVEVEEAKEKDLTLEKSVYGRVSPNSTAPVMVQTPGEVKEVYVENGEEVKDNDRIIRISTPAGEQNVRASKDGEVINLLVQEGEMVNPEEAIAMITDLDSVKIEFTVTESVLSLVSENDKLSVYIDDEEYEATVTNKGTLPGETGLYTVIATVENEDHEILPGVVADVRIPEEKLASAMIVPTSALVEEDNQTFVYIVKDNVATKQEVNVLATESDVTAIEGDVKASDQVITTGQLTISDGTQVNVTGGE